MLIFHSGGLVKALEKLNLISLLKKIISSEAVYRDKYSNLKNISYQNKWDDINKKLIKLINEN